MGRGGRVVGMIVFTIGILLLLAVFAAAYRMFSMPVEASFASGGKSPLTVSEIGSSSVFMLARIGLLFVMTIAGSIVAGKGIHLYLGCREAAAASEK